MNFDPTDEKLSGLLKQARPTGELPPGFQNRVWQRIERLDQKPASFLDRLASWILIPRIAAGALAGVMFVSAAAGAVHGTNAGAHEARDRYIASVDPSYLPH